MGLGKSSVGIVGYINNIYTNPSGICGITSPQVSVSYHQIASNVEGGGIPLSTIVFGLPIMRDIVVSGGWSNLAVSGMYSDNIFIVGGAKKMSPQLSVGAAVKMLKETYEGTEVENNPYFANSKEAAGFSVDAGAIFNLTKQMSVGASLQNVNQPNVAINSEADNKVPMVIRAGAVYNFSLTSPGFVSVEVAVNQLQGTEMNFGVEKQLFSKQFNARGGVNYILDSQSANVSVGADIALGQIKLEYAFLFQVLGGFEAYKNHYVGLSISF